MKNVFISNWKLNVGWIKFNNSRLQLQMEKQNGEQKIIIIINGFYIYDGFWVNRIGIRVQRLFIVEHFGKHQHRTSTTRQQYNTS